MKNPRLRSLKPTHTVDFFDSSTMRNRTEPCIVECIALASFSGGYDAAQCRLTSPPTKRVVVPLSCLVDLATGQRLPYPTDNLVVEEFSLGPEELAALSKEK